MRKALKGDSSLENLEAGRALKGGREELPP